MDALADEAVRSKSEQRRLQNRASVQKCRGKQRARLEALHEERDRLAVENRLLQNLKAEIERSGVLQMALALVPEGKVSNAQGLFDICGEQSAHGGRRLRRDATLRRCGTLASDGDDSADDV